MVQLAKGVEGWCEAVRRGAILRQGRAAAVLRRRGLGPQARGRLGVGVGRGAIGVEGRGIAAAGRVRRPHDFGAVPVG